MGKIFSWSFGVFFNWRFGWHVSRVGLVWLNWFGGNYHGDGYRAMDNVFLCLDEIIVDKTDDTLLFLILYYVEAGSGV